MGWTDLAILGAGLSIGSVGGWLTGRLNAAKTRAAVADRSPEAEAQALKTQLHQMQLAYQMVKEMEQFKAGFLARTSHELRSPINSVIGLHQLILSELCDTPAEEREFVAQSYAAAEKMLALLDQLIHVAKAVHGGDRLQLQPVCLQNVLAEVQTLTYLQAQNHGIRLQVDLPAAELQVLTDPRWLTQVVMSLIDTPIALMQGGSVRLKTQVDPIAKQVYLDLEDQRPASFWSEPIDLMQAIKTAKEEAFPFPATTASETNGVDIALPPRPSPGLTLMANQSLLEVMGGRLEILAVPDSSNDDLDRFLTRMRCTLPLADEGAI